MKLTEILKKAWDNLPQIAEGFYNAYVSQNKEIREEVMRRKAICEINVCGHYDAEGAGDNVILPGKPACGLCGCNIPAKPACLSCTCSLADIFEEPLWGPVMTQEQEDHLRETLRIKREAYEQAQAAKKQNNG